MATGIIAKCAFDKKDYRLIEIGDNISYLMKMSEQKTGVERQKLVVLCGKSYSMPISIRHCILENWFSAYQVNQPCDPASSLRLVALALCLVISWAMTSAS